MKKALLTLLFLPLTLLAQVANDDCSTATVLTVNSSTECTATMEGTLNGSTPQTGVISCITAPTADVWYEFTATNKYHYISLSTETSLTSLGIAVYTGCSTTETILDPIYCTDNQLTLNCTQLEVGTTYKVMVYSNNADASALDFSICVSTYPNIVTVSGSEYTVEELVSEVLLTSETSSLISNISSFTSSETGVNGIGYFNNNEGNFAFPHGIVLSTGSINNVPGLNTFVSNSGGTLWPGDQQLTDYINDYQGNTNTATHYNASIIEFDFVPLTNSISFEFIFASEEYGLYQCSYSDAFAIFLTDITEGNEEAESVNIATVPGTYSRVASTTIRNNLYNGGCTSVNSQYFDSYNVLPANAIKPGVPINFNGYTTPLLTQADVVPGNTYHIKFVISDRGDAILDSAVFINGEDFNLGTNGDNLTLDAPEGYILQFYTEGETLADLNVTGAGIQWYSDEISTTPLPESTELANGQTYYASQTILELESTERLAVTVHLVTANNLVECDQYSDGFATFNLEVNNNVVLGNLNSSLYYVGYYLTYEDALYETNPIQNLLYTNVIPYTQTIYVRLTNLISGFYDITSFELNTIQAPAITTPQDITVTDNPVDLTVSNTEILTGLNAEGFTISFYNSETSAYAASPEIQNQENYIAFNGETIWIRVEQNETGCFSVTSQNVYITNSPPTGNMDQLFYAGEMLSDLEVTGENIQWYQTETGDTPLPMNTLLEDGITYYASQTIDETESTQRLAVTVHLVTANNLVECDQYSDGFATFNLEANNSVVLGNLDSSLYYLGYYLTYENALYETNPIQNLLYTNVVPYTQTIYVRLTHLISGFYAIASFELNTIQAPAITTPQDITAANNNVDLTVNNTEILNELNAEEFTISFYNSETSAYAASPEIQNPENYIASNGETIWIRVEQNETGCFSVTSQNVYITVPAPTGNINQSFYAGEMLSDLEVTGENLQWYETETGDTPLSMNTPLEDGFTYYATQSIDGTESSERLGVTTHQILGIEDQVFKNLTYYPNPVSSILTLSNVNDISKIEAYNMLGQKVIDKDFNTTEVQLDMSSLETGIYLIKVTSLDQQKIIRIQKQ